ncbi:transmembrane protein 52B [Heteronotia binoei]|uniref:transmembrane protein 52B n=1 Tax=Heteronotia binoei TaxID=13085 RepID=UPI00292F0955|nr:transmembrane protein 52B [Heteronotia binoei]
MGKSSHVVIISALASLSQVPLVELQGSCTNAGHCPDANLIHIWYIWLAVAIGGLLLLCGLVSICVKCCCLNCQPAGDDNRTRPYEVTVIAFDQDSSTLQSTITSLHSVFGPAARRILAVAHSHGAGPGAHPSAGGETPPIYEEALRMSRFTVARMPDVELVPEEQKPETKAPEADLP